MPTLPPNATEAEKLQHIADQVLDREAMRRVMQEAVAEGIKAAVSDPALWAAAGAAMQTRAQNTAGGWLFSGLRAVFSRVGFIVMLLVGMGMVGGWQGFLAALRALGGGHAP